MSEIAEDVSVSMYQQSALTAGNVMPVRVRIPHHMSSHILILHPSACESSSIAQMTLHETRPKTPNLNIQQLMPIEASARRSKKEVRNQGSI